MTSATAQHVIAATNLRQQWRTGMLDRLNALLWLDEDEEARRLLLNRWIEARHNAPALTNELHMLAAVLAPETSEWRRLVQALRDEQYEALEAFTENLERHAEVVLRFLHASQFEIWPKSQADVARINQQISLLEKGLALQPDWKPTHEALAEALSARGYYFAAIRQDYTSALADYNRALALRPDDPDTLSNRGIVKRQMGDLEGALADYNRALALRPDDPNTLSNRGYVKQEMGDLEGALADYNRALALRPDDPRTLNNRGIVKRQMGDLEGALADYNRALELRPNNANTMYNLACLYALQGDADAALPWLARAIAGDEQYRAKARRDSDFDSIRADPRFVALVVQPPNEFGV